MLSSEESDAVQTFEEGVWLIIPAYNVEKYLGTLLGQVKDIIPPRRTIIVDDGSSDETASIGELAGAAIIRHKTNQGKGAALQTGIRNAAEVGASWVVTMDGDLQHDPSCLSDFIKTAKRGEADVIIGRRKISGSKMPLDRRFSNWASTILLQTLTGVRLYDVQCGYRMLRVKLLRSISCLAKKYDYETEVLLHLIQHKARIDWVDIPTYYGDQSSSIRRWSDSIRFIKLALDYMTKRI